jgi:SAM-dependent methyltransferase
MRLLDHQRYLRHAYSLDVHELDATDASRVVRGCLVPRSPGKADIPIIAGIPRFVPAENYAANFGLQWNTFRSTQLDSRTGLPLSADRFWKNTRWNPADLKDRSVLEIGSGAGRFTEILLGAGARVISVDYSTAIDANLANNGGLGDAFFMQADLYDLPLEDAQFDFVFCYGVLQHTPDPDLAFRRIFAKLRPGGQISIDYYRKFRLPNVWSTPKYFWRPFVKDMAPEKLLRIISGYMPYWFPVDNAIRHIPKLGPALLALVPIPCWNYLGSGLSYAQRKEWAVLDTFDALGAAYDEPKTLEEVEQLVRSPENASTLVFYGSNGVVANVRKRTN